MQDVVKVGLRITVLLFDTLSVTSLSLLPEIFLNTTDAVFVTVEFAAAYSALATQLTEPLLFAATVCVHVIVFPDCVPPLLMEFAVVFVGMVSVITLLS